ncbi:MAG TPA: alpha/beta fold hydrolase, partial [Paraburkholderia sp.]|nr:alpha/beta fold hydrolase [Paraburkholderia sp.]
MDNSVDLRRRRLLGSAVAGLSLAELGLGSIARAQTPPSAANKKSSGGSAAFGPIQQIDAGALNIGYVDAGPRHGPVVLLLHGWPYDIHSFAEVTPHLTAAGYRVIVPYLRGYGSTRFLSADTPR